jgi:hypothetical protein
MTPAGVAGWNLALRFALEVAALIEFGSTTWELGSGPSRRIAMVGATG